MSGEEEEAAEEALAVFDVIIGAVVVVVVVYVVSGVVVAPFLSSSLLFLLLSLMRTAVNDLCLFSKTMNIFCCHQIGFWDFFSIFALFPMALSFPLLFAPNILCYVSE